MIDISLLALTRAWFATVLAVAVLLASFAIEQDWNSAVYWRGLPQAFELIGDEGPPIVDQLIDIRLTAWSEEWIDALLVSAMSMATLPRLGSAQGARPEARIGWITAQNASSLTPYVEAFRTGLADFGYLEGRNLVLMLRYGDDHLERVPKMTAELVQVPVDVIVAQGAANFLINKLVLPVPVAYAFSGDPVKAGFADSLARPHANMTGVSLMAPQLTAKRLELLGAGAQQPVKPVVQPRRASQALIQLESPNTTLSEAGYIAERRPGFPARWGWGGCGGMVEGSSGSVSSSVRSRAITDR